jgi:hypothetical protein
MELEERQQEIRDSAELSSLLERLSDRARPVLDRMTVVPE